MSAIRWIGLAVLLLIVAIGGRLVWRVMEEREHAPIAVREIIASADPAIARISKERIDELLRVEDPTFWTNDGIDLTTTGAGLTTLSQGLGKLIFFDRFTPGLAKIELMVLTKFALVPTVSKQDILVAMLARAYLGSDDKGQVIGFAEGARRWFGKELDVISEREFLGLVAMLIGPNRLDPIRNRQAHDERVNRIERLLAGKCQPSSLTDVELVGCAEVPNP